LPWRLVYPRFSQAQFAAFVRDDVAANIALVNAAKIPTE
jgi:hypothetical protein